MSIVIMKECGGCGVQRPVYADDFKHVDVETGEEWKINHVTLADWNDRKKCYNSKVSFYNLCPECARIWDDALAKMKNSPKFKKMEPRNRKFVKKDKPKETEVVTEAEPVEGSVQTPEVQNDGE